MEKRSMERLVWPLRTEVIDPISNRVLSDTARVQNITCDGFSILTENRLPPNTPYKFKVSLNYADSINLKGRVIRSQSDTLFQRSGVVFEPEAMDDRISLNRFLASRIPAYKRRMRIYALGGGEAAFLIGQIAGFSSPLSVGLGLLTALVLLVWLPF